MTIKNLSNNKGISEVLANIPQGDLVVLNIDEALVHNPAMEYGNIPPALTESNLPTVLRYLKETKHPVILLTSHNEKYNENTIAQLKQLDLSYDILIHAKDNVAVLLEYLKKNSLSKRLHVIDNDKAQLEAIDKAISTAELNIKTTCYHYKPNTRLLTNPKQEGFPENLDSIKLGESLGGGTSSTYIVQDKSDKKNYVLKFGSSEVQIKVEALINVLYQRLGVPVADVQAYRSLSQDLAQSLNFEHAERTVQLAEWLKPDQIQDEKVIITQACRNFIVHAFMGNIDVAKLDNFIQTEGGKAKLIDSGACFIFRALGDLREEMSAEVSEIDSMRNHEINLSGAQWFGDLSPEEIKSQVHDLIKQRSTIEKTIWEVSQQLEIPSFVQRQLLSGFSNRLDNLAQRYGFATQHFAKRDKAAIAEKTAAGVMHIQKDERGQLCVLLSKRARHNWCDNFGGKSDADDVSLARTAQREAKEESNGVLDYSDRELAEAPFHDIITQDTNGQQFLYRMYFIEGINPVDTTQLLDKEHESYHWVPLQNLQSALKTNSTVVEEEQITIQVKDIKNEDVIIFPPLYSMLRQRPVNTLIDELLLNSNFRKQSTQGLAEEPDSSEQSKKNIYRPIASPEQVESEIITTSIKKAKVLGEIKNKRETRETFSKEGKQPANTDERILSQSELHLKAVMGDDFHIQESTAENIKRFLDIHYKGLSEEEKQRLINQAAEMIQYEKDHPERVYFYHGTNSDIAYAYAVYTAIYQILAANSDIGALRMDNPLFHKCLTVEEFISHFKVISESGKVSNYDSGYMESAISANLFLFGSHNVEGSNTIEYYTNNESAAKTNLQNMLSASVQSMGVGVGIINQLIALAKEFPYQGQGALYQVSIPLDVVDKYAYAAAPGGRLNPLLTESGETTNISQLLNEMTRGRVDKQYIETLQARVMSPPDAPITTRDYHWGNPVNQEMQDNFNHKIEKLAENIVFDIMKHQNQLNKLNSKLPLMRNLRDVYKQAGLNIGSNKITDELVIQLLESGDFESIKRITETHPEFKEKLIKSNKISYSNRDSSKNESKTLLERLLTTPNGQQTLIAIYGEKFYEGRLDKLPFISVFFAIEKSNRMQFAIDHQDKIKDANTLILILNTLPDDKKFDFADKLKHIINDHYDLGDVLKSLPLEQRLNFASQFRSKINSQYVLTSILSKLPENQRFDFAKEYKHNIKDAVDLYAVSSIIPDKQRLAFIMLSQNIINDITDVARIMSVIPDNERSLFASMHEDKMYSGDYLLILLKLIPKDQQMVFLLRNEHKIRNTKELAKVLGSLPEEKRIDFLDRHKMKIKNAKDLADVLMQLNQDKRISVATEHGDTIKDGKGLSYVLMQLSLSDRLHFATEHGDKITDVTGLSDVIDELSPSDRLDFATEHEDKIQNAEGLYDVLGVLSSRTRFGFAIRHVNKITDDSAIESIQMLLPRAERTNFIATIKAYEKQLSLSNSAKIHVSIAKIDADERKENISAVYRVLENDDFLRNQDGTVSSIIKQIKEIVSAIDSSKEENITSAIVEIKKKIVENKDNNHSENANCIIDAFAKPSCLNFRKIRETLSTNPAIDEIMNRKGFVAKNE
ncbi:TPA: NUDIX domain-containing protein [Legionella pneumophila]|nr:NUDIX hydrolase [Legionella pneumophila]HAT8866667.1 NUDIX domain-containing protein [Legionella pneumophila subsp. pneumophila]HAT7071484.1 NUDIX domain-containing protein [Legionella pneumophila]HAT8640515.1 NUDIX domain-containing protein [Legionella pneumophila]HAT8888390.1 NUDIX domain-containing protein [Legionella pneumophila subsp. pneumophila]HAT8931770.1 NUDIX domain-containing protein [Legionella pneumophila subsp. pneumophila]